MFITKVLIYIFSFVEINFTWDQHFKIWCWVCGSWKNWNRRIWFSVQMSQ